MKKFFKFLIYISIICLSFYSIINFKQTTVSKFENTLNIVVTIKPIHSLVAAVAKGVFEPVLLIEDNQSPHIYHLTPLKRQILQQANKVIWIGKIYESAIAQNLEKTVEKKNLLTLSQIQDLKLLPYRKGELWEDHGDVNHVHDTHVEDHDHSHSLTDGHIWLNPENAIKIVQYIKDFLKENDSKNKEIYELNAQNLIVKIKNLDQDIKDKISLIKQKKYLLYHDATQYFDDHFGTQAIGTIANEPGQPIKTYHLLKLRDILNNKNSPYYPYCIFVEKQFPNEISKNLAKEFNIKYQEIDYLGQDVKIGPNAYFEIMNDLKNSLLIGLS